MCREWNGGFHDENARFSSWRAIDEIMRRIVAALLERRLRCACHAEEVWRLGAHGRDPPHGLRAVERFVAGARRSE
jgi:hypothetical protein